MGRSVAMTTEVEVFVASGLAPRWTAKQAPKRKLTVVT